MKLLHFLLTALVLLVFAVPAFACDQCAPGSTHILASVDISADSVDLATTTNEWPTVAPALAVLFIATPVPAARDVYAPTNSKQQLDPTEAAILVGGVRSHPFYGSTKPFGA